ncbi:TIGR03032 family protein, partial [bacterium]|nr:TIGR03032 family protein [bacterium]
MTTPSISVSRNFLNWLHDEKISIALTTYQTNRLFLLGRKPDGGLSAFERVFDRPMGLFVKGQSIYLSTRYLLWRLDNVLPTGELYEGYDRLYIPRSANNTGDIDIHDVVLDKDGTLICANTEYSCLARLDERHSFKVFWQPLFISQLVPEDRCHLNGIALVDGRAKYVTAVSNSDTVGGWRKKRSDGGLLIDIDTNDVILDSLSMPHSPRWYKGRLWVLNSGAGELGWVDCAKGSFTPVCFCPGYLRGLTFHKNFAIAGLSKPRKRTELSDLPFERELQRKNTEPLCGLMCIDLDTGNIAHWLEFDSVITEIYDIQILHGVIQPMLFGLMSNEIARTITFEEDEKIMRHT